MGGKSGGISGYRYYMGLHFGLCHGPVDAFLEIRAGDRTAWTGAQTASGQISIATPNLFGGDTKEGGINGLADVMMGEATQGVNAYLLAEQGSPQPGYRGLCTLVYKGGEVGSNNPYPKPWSFRLRRALAGWSGGSAWNPSKAAITLSSGVVGMNPAHMVYEVLTNPDWGMGYPTAALDNTVFTASALQLYNEGFGLCLLWNRQDTIDSFLQKIMDYIAGVLVTSPITGLFQLKLIRGGYDPATLPVFTDDDILEVTDKEDSTLTGSVNEMWIKYFDPISKQTQSVALQALGAVQSQGVVIPDFKTFTGISTADLAARVCQRELAGSTVPLKRAQVKMKRSAYLLTPGDVFVGNFPKSMALASVIFRVGEIDTGTLLDGSISLMVVEDVFSMPADTYIAPQTSGWTPPNNHPVAATIYTAHEPDYRSLYKLIGGSAAAALSSVAAYDGILVARPDPLCQNYANLTEVGGVLYVNHGNWNFSPTGVLQSGIGAFDLSMHLQTAIDLSHVVVPCAAWIEDTVGELVNVTAIDLATGICTIARGCGDSIASGHLATTRVYFVDGYIGSDGLQYVAAEVIHNKPCPNAPLGRLDQSLSTDIPVTLIARQAFPYPPALPKINGTRYDLAAAPTGPFTLSWAERNRLTQADLMVDQTAATVTPETGTTYTVRVIDTAGPTLLRTFSGLTGTSQVINVGASAALSIELESVRGGLTSLQHWAIPITFTSGSVQITDESGVNLTDESGVLIFTE